MEEVLLGVTEGGVHLEEAERIVIPAKAGIQSIHKEEWIPSQAGNDKKRQGGNDKKNGSPIRSGMTIYFPDRVGDDGMGVRVRGESGNPKNSKSE